MLLLREAINSFLFSRGYIVPENVHGHLFLKEHPSLSTEEKQKLDYDFYESPYFTEMKLLSGAHEIVDYFLSGRAGELNGRKYCFNLEKINQMNELKLSTIAIFSILDRSHNKKGVVLANCSEDAKRMIKLYQVENLFEYVSGMSQL